MSEQTSTTPDIPPAHVSFDPPAPDLSAPPSARVPLVVFVGGTGRSGTHVIAKLIAKGRRFRSIPVECRFHVDADGFPGLLAGEVSKRRFLRRMRGFWWKGFQTNRLRGMYRFIPRERYEEALGAFERSFDDDPEGACRQLFLDLLLPHAHARNRIAIVEQSCDTIAQAPTLVRLFPEARFVHVVRDGRDASASRVGQTRGIVYPRTRRQGLEWWERRIRAIDAGARAIPPGALLELSLDELLEGDQRGALGPLARFVGTAVTPAQRNFFRSHMGASEANLERWRRGLSERRARELERRYEEVLMALEADGITCAPLLRRTFERRRSTPAAATESSETR